MTPREIVEQLVKRRGWECRVMQPVPFDEAYLGIDVGEVRITARGATLDDCYRKMAEYLRATTFIETGLFESTEPLPDMVGEGLVSGLQQPPGTPRPMTGSEAAEARAKRPAWAEDR